MIKKIFFLLCLLFIAESPIFADDSWDSFANVDRMWDGQKSITNQQFEEVMEKLEEKKVQKEEKIKKKKFKSLFGNKGQSLHTELNPDIEIPEFENLKDADDGILVNIPVQIIIDGKPLERGYYKLVAESSENGKKYINFYQSQFLKGKIEVNETQDDFDQKELDFAEIQPYNESFIKLIFGCIDFNAYTYIPFLE